LGERAGSRPAALYLITIGLQFDALGVHAGDEGSGSDLDAHRLELGRGPPGEALVESLQDARRRVEQDDARSSSVD